MIVKCRNCELKFDKKPSEVKRTKNHYCSKQCKGDFLSRKNISSFYDKSKLNGECMEWTGCVNNSGYGVVRYKGKVMLAHRVSYIISNGEIDSEVNVCHRCDNPRCVTPSHLFLGTQAENMEDMRVKLRKWSKLTFDDVAEIRASNLSARELSEAYSVSDRTIRYARDATHWMPLPPTPQGE